jgi:hypothetical protein
VSPFQLWPPRPLRHTSSYLACRVGHLVPPPLAQVDAVLCYAHENSVQPFMEPVLELCLALLVRDQQLLAAGVPSAGATRGLASRAGAAPRLLAMAAGPDAPVAALAAECLCALGAAFPHDLGGGRGRGGLSDRPCRPTAMRGCRLGPAGGRGAGPDGWTDLAAQRPGALGRQIGFVSVRPGRSTRTNGDAAASLHRLSGAPTAG